MHIAFGRMAERAEKKSRNTYYRYKKHQVAIHRVGNEGWAIERGVGATTWKLIEIECCARKRASDKVHSLPPFSYHRFIISSLFQYYFIIFEFQRYIYLLQNILQLCVVLWMIILLYQNFVIRTAKMMEWSFCYILLAFCVSRQSGWKLNISFIARYQIHSMASHQVSLDSAA